jgi:two-component system response regulator AdeR
VSGNDGTATVLVVDDEPTSTDVYARVLEKQHTVRKAYSGEEALEKIDESVDVVLLDRRMPEMSGDEVLAAMQRRKLDCRVAMVTAVDPDFDIVGMGFDDYVVKPLDRDDLLAIVDRLLTLDSYDEKSRELSSLQVKRNVLTMEKSDAELADSDEYDTLERRIEELTAELEDMETELVDVESVVDNSTRTGR